MSDTLIQTTQIKPETKSLKVLRLTPKSAIVETLELAPVAAPQLVPIASPKLVPELKVVPLQKAQEQKEEQAQDEEKVEFSRTDDFFFHNAMKNRREKRIPDAIAMLENLRTIYPKHIWLNLKLIDCYMDLKNYTKVIPLALEARKLKLDNHQLNCLRCIQYFAYFFTKDYKKAWPIYMEFLGEVKRSAFFDKSKAPEIRKIPRWNGIDKNLTIGVVNDEGIGDGIFMARFIPQFLKKNMKIVVFAKPNLIHLYKQIIPNTEIISLHEQNLGHVDVWTSVMDIPHFLDVDVEEYQAKKPYIHAKPELITQWGQKINTKRGLKVGLSWQGNPDISLDQHRSIPLETLKPIIELEGIRFFNMQMGKGEEQVEACSFKDKIESLGAFDKGSDAFEDTLAIVKNMDVVLTIDSSLGHICGAAHVPVLIMLNSFIASWRWGTDKHNTEWYPYHRLFKQKEAKKWDNVIADVTHALTVMRNNRVPLLNK